MIYEFNKKQKIIIVIIGLMISIAFLYFIYTKEDSMVISTEENIEDNIEKNIADLEEDEKTTTETADEIIVHISGAVNKEGIVELEQNSRISDAINKAEGLKENADTKNINLAFKLEDGMKIYIPTIEETAKETAKENEQNENYHENDNLNQNMVDETSKYITSSSGVVSEEINEQSGQNQNQKININTATQTELETLPGIGPSTSLKIINYRKENGKFKTIEEIKEVSGIGDAKYANIKDLICVK